MLNSAAGVVFPPAALPPIKTICAIFETISGFSWIALPIFVIGPNTQSVTFSSEFKISSLRNVTASISSSVLDGSGKGTPPNPSVP